ncbi:AAA family ATPase [Parafrankia discariae]|uniref:AAA family ATPase n=1 Tax=Parafrankia discariae TaxID=365528 RepID=UPI00035FFD68
MRGNNRVWPPAPPWRAFNGGPDQPDPPTEDGEAARRLGAGGVRLLDRAALGMVNAAIVLRRPLLVTGSPGSGKSSLSYQLAMGLGLGRVLRWPITSRSTLRHGLYDYDGIGRAQAMLAAGSAGAVRQPRDPADDSIGSGRTPPGAAPPVGDFVHLGPLGTALLPHHRPRVLLVDELDKSDVDLPNDLLNVFEDGEFTLPELVQVRELTPRARVNTADPGGKATVHNGVIRCHEFPLVVITSNGEREFPPAFLRRCTRLDIPEPDPERLAELIAAHFPKEVPGRAELVERFARRRAAAGPLAADQLLNAAYLLALGADADGPDTWSDLLDHVWHRLSSDTDTG